MTSQPAKIENKKEEETLKKIILTALYLPKRTQCLSKFLTKGGTYLVTVTEKLPMRNRVLAAFQPKERREALPPWTMEFYFFPVRFLV